jgi:hypothetical protein
VLQPANHPRLEESVPVSLSAFSAPLVAAALGLLAVLFRWRGVDLPAQIYRVGLFHRSGFTLWDSQWYGGHWTLSYSVLFSPIAGIVGVQVAEIASAALASLAFDRLVVGHFGRSARAGSIMFAVWTLAQLAIGQLPFLLGEALALCALVAVSRRMWWLAALLGIAAALASPLAAAFLILALCAWLVTLARSRLLVAVVIAAPAATIVGLGILFPGQGSMPFSAVYFWLLLAAVVCVFALLPPEERVLRVGVFLYGGAVALSFLLPTPMGANIIRLAQCVGAPLLACLLWQRRRTLLAVPIVALGVWQWAPAWGAIVTNGSDPSTRQAYYQPLVRYLDEHKVPAGRVEIVPTRLHWEAAYVAPAVPLARGWERQLDTADNPVFYQRGRLTPANYKAWLLDNGVRFVALPDAAVDYAAADEVRIVQSGVPGLREVWHDTHWRLFEIDSAPGIVEGPASLVRLDGGIVDLRATAPGAVIVRVRYSDHWSVAEGNACIQRAANDWTSVVVRQPGSIRLDLKLRASDRDVCP